MTDDVKFNPEATDGDGDGMVQDGTEFERPVGTMPEGFNPEATDGDGDGLVQDGTEFERPVEADQADSTVITGKSTGGSDEQQVLDSVQDGVIGTTTKKVSDKKPAAKKAPKPASGDKVALFAERNLVWQGLGKIVKGYNFVDKDNVAQWLTIKGVREATPEEIKTNLG